MSGQLKTRLIVAAIAVVVVTGVVIAIVLGTSRSRSSEQASGDTVRVELRASGAKLKMKGRDLGRAPVTVHLPRSSEPVEVEATFTLHLLHTRTKQPATELRKQTKLVIPDQDKTVDFNIKDAKSTGEITPRAD